MTRFSRSVFLSGKSWQYLVAMHSQRGPGQEKRPFMARYRRHASKMSWFWQDMLSMYSKCPAKCRRGMHFASTLPRRPSFSVRIPQIMHSGQILPLFFDLPFVRELCDSCLCGSSGRDRHHGSTFTGVLACPLREGASAVARPLCGAQASPFVLYVKVQALRLVLYVEVPAP